jgi:hypothetical protein
MQVAGRGFPQQRMDKGLLFPTRGLMALGTRVNKRE